MKADWFELHAAETAALGVYRPDLYRSALAPLSARIPEEDLPIVSREDFFDHCEFDPQQFMNQHNSDGSL